MSYLRSSLASEVRILPSPHQLFRQGYGGMEDTKLRFDEVLYELEQERLRVDEDLRRLTAAAAYLRTQLPPKRPRRTRRRCSPRH